MRVKVLVFIFILIFALSVNVFATTESNNSILNGIDVSDWQGSINFNQVKQSGIDIVYIKATQGTNIIDTYFKTNYNNAKLNGLKVGFYHYLTAKNETEAIQQAEFFSYVISNTIPDCRLAMDFEQFGNLNNVQINNISRAFLNKVKELTGKEVIIYSDASNALNVFSSELANEYPLWVAEYGTNTVSLTNWQFWYGFQFTDRGRIDGIQGFVDLDKFTTDILLNENVQLPIVRDLNYSQNIDYTVQRGNTLSFIARKYNTTVNQLVSLNDIRNPNLIFVGEILRIPQNVDNMNQNELYDLGHTIYIVKPGNTLSGIARRFGVTVQNIAVSNDIKNVNLIFVGEKLRIDK